MYAENHCWKLRCGGVPWSPQLQDIRTKLTFWNAFWRKKSGKKVNSHHLHCLCRKAGIAFPSSTSLEEASQQCKTLYQQLHRFSKSAAKARSTWLEQLAEARAKSTDTKAATELKNLTQREYQRRLARQVRQVNGRFRNGGITAVVAPSFSDPTQWVEMTRKQDIELSCLNENERRFNQASHTPFLQPPLFDAVGPCGLGPDTEAILSGTYDPPPELDIYTKKLLPYLARPESFTPSSILPTYFETPKVSLSWLKAKEYTSSNPDGLHFGHHKAFAQDPLLADIDAALTNIPFATGYSPTRWQRGVNCMLVKKAGNFRVDKLRTILLYDARFNHGNKILGRDMLANAEAHNWMAKEQYGSRKNKSAIEQCLNKRLTYDLARQRKLPCALCFNDMKSCYDRIVHAVAGLCMNRMGVPWEAIICMFGTIQQVEHAVRTVYGDSKRCFTGRLWIIPIQGVGQGNGAGPQIWAIISTPVLEMLRGEGFGVIIATSIRRELIHFVGYSFVDDNDLCEMARANQSAVDVALSLQESLNHWEGGIRATGGALVPEKEKSFWYLIDFKWTQGEWRYATNDEAPGTLRVHDLNGDLQILDRLAPQEARRTLGVRLAPDGNNGAELEHLISLAADWSERVRTGYLSRDAAWFNLTSVVLKQLQYPLAVTTFSKEECEQILRPCLAAGLSSSGINRNFPRILAHAPFKYQGLNIPHLYTSQGVRHLLQCLQHAHVAEDLTGQLIRASLEALQIEIGCPGNPFDRDFSIYQPLVTPCWLSHTWEFLTASDISLRLQAAEIPLRRRGDQYLIPTFVAAGYRRRTLCQLNQCRLFLHATTLADITTGAGDTITLQAWAGLPDPTRPTYYEWPRQGNPSSSSWDLWRKALTRAFHLSPARALPYPLRSWTDSPDTWLWWYCPSEERLYCRTTDTWQYWRKNVQRSTRSGYTFLFGGDCSPSDIPSPLLRCTIYRHGNKTSVSVSPPDPESPTLTHSSFQDYLDSLSGDTLWAIDDVHWSDAALSAILSSLSTGGCIAVSDGSFKDSFGTSAWGIEGPSQSSGTPRIWGSNDVPGPPDAQSAYRSEIAGLCGIVTFLDILVSYFGILEGTVTVGCDGINALRKCFEPTWHPSATEPHFDLISAVRTKLSRSPLTWRFRHVAGHQDDEPYAVLDRWAHFNIDMDLLAKTRWHRSHLHQGQTVPNPNEISDSPWSVWIGPRQLVKNINEEIVSHIQGREALDWWVHHKQRFSLEQADRIDWLALGNAMQNSKHSRRLWVSKQVSGMAATGKQMFARKKRQSPQCPRCFHSIEDSLHVLKCPHHTAIHHWQDSVSKFCLWLQQQRTAPPLIAALRHKLLSWKDPTFNEPFPTSGFRGLQSALESQDDLGWRNFIEGRISVEWAEVQDTYYRWLDSRKTGRRWASALIRKIWEIAWDQWEHRNATLHPKGKVSSIPVRELNRAIRTEYLLGPQGLLPSNRHLLSHPIWKLLNQSVHQRRQWLANVKAARLSRARPRPNQLQLQRRFMHRWRQAARSHRR